MYQHLIIARIYHQLQMWIQISQNREACGPPFEALGLHSDERELIQEAISKIADVFNSY